MTSVRQWNRETDYATFCAWWDAHGQASPLPEMLPECGLIVERDGIPKLAAWLYQDNSCGVAWLAWVTKNPAIHARETATDVKVLLGAVDEIARTQNRHTVICTTKVRGLGRTLMRCGYAANHEVMEYFRGVPHGS